MGLRIASRFVLALALVLAGPVPPAMSLAQVTSGAKESAASSSRGRGGKARGRKARGKGSRGKKARGKGSRGKRSRSRYYHYKHKVLPGETLSHIAARYHVEVKDILRWNDLPSADIVRAGQTLHVWTPHPVRPRRIIEHKVRKGETLGRIARKYDMDVKSLARLNRIRDPRRLRAGKTIKVVVEGPEIPSVSRGTPQHGKLINGEQLPPGPGFYIRNRHKAWGTNNTITRLLEAFRKMWKRFPGSVVAIGDISRKHGGYFPPHVSHQNGRDVDIAFYVKKKKVLKRFVKVTPKTIDARRTWALIEALLEGGGVKYVFIDYPLQKVLYEQARASGWSKKRLRKVFQYPRGRRAGAIIMHEKGHDDHMHVRFED